eukprot:CAMPEP_0169187228 /NCGR_PEP_ID=MMETSP1016-20121227/2803_1 /TAXON_ID=342587 /ORGANISM="Karlodinium micrum, Strain CCMP2283" /LENGTH=35 /DNA_ID= /DNA_START= /DNA_END= /DNA_ORIENTATION=
MTGGGIDGGVGRAFFASGGSARVGFDSAFAGGAGG